MPCCIIFFGCFASVIGYKTNKNRKNVLKNLSFRMQKEKNFTFSFVFRSLFRNFAARNVYFRTL